MNKNASALFKKLGIPEEVVKAIIDETAELDVAKAFGAVDAHLKEVYAQDEDFTKPIADRAVGEALGSKENYLMKVAAGKLTKEDLDGLPKINRFNKLVELFAERTAAQEGGKGKKEDSELLKEIDKLNGEVAGFQTKLKTYDEEVIPAAKAEAQKVADRYHFEREIEREAVRDGRKTVLPMEKLISLFRPELEGLADFAVENGKTVVREKGKTTPLRDPNDRNKTLGVADLVTRVGEQNGFFIKNNGKEGAKPAFHHEEPATNPQVRQAPGEAARRERVAARAEQ